MEDDYYNLQEEVDNCSNKLKQLHEINPKMAKKEIKLFNSKLNSLIKYEKIEKDKTKPSNKSVLIVLSIIIFLEILFLVDTNSDSLSYFLYLFGYAFFLSGHFIGMNVPYAGIVFLFTHSVTGMCIMISSLVGKSIVSPVITDLSQTAINYLVICLILFILATLYVIAYNISSKVREVKYSNYIPLCIYILAFAMTGMFNHLIGVKF